MAGPFTLDYFVFVFIAAFGVLQMAAAYSPLRGLLFIRARPWAFTAGLVTAALAFLWFFVSEPRNIPDTDGGLDGNEMGGLFTLAAGSALVLTLLLSSVRNRSMGRNWQRSGPGLDVLRETTYVRALQGAIRHLWKRQGRSTPK